MKTGSIAFVTRWWAFVIAAMGLKTPGHVWTASASPADGLVAWWRGESNTLDSVDYNHGTMSPGTPPLSLVYSNGPFGACFALRVGNYVVIPAGTNLDLGVGEGLTIEAWVNPASTSYPILEWNSGTGTQGVFLAYSTARGPNYLEANLVDAQGNAHWILSPFLPTATNQWRHVTLTYNRASGLAVLYTNGTAVAQTNLGSFIPRTTGNVYLGYRPPGNYPGSGARWNGYVDEVALHRRALTPEEVRSLYLSGPAGKYPPPQSCVRLAEGIVSWWRFESNTLDSVQANHGSAPGVLFTAGKVGSALAFYVGLRAFTVPNPVGLDVGSGPGFTVEGWYKPAADPLLSERIVQWWAPPLLGVSLTYSASRELRATLPGVSNFTGSIVSPVGILKAGQWQHVALIYDRTSGWGTLSVNGNPVAATNMGSFAPVTTGDLAMGWPLMRGLLSASALDEVAIYDRALKPFEIYSIYQAANGRCMEPPQIVLHPASQRVNAGSTVTFAAQAVGNPILRYHWGYGPHLPERPSLLPGQTNSVLVLTNVQAKDERVYWVRVTNAFGVAVSSNALLEVNYPPVADASATRLSYVVRPECAPATVVLDGSRSSDPDGDPLQYFWFRAGQTYALATGVVAVVRLPIGSHALTLVVDDGLAIGTQTFTVELLTPAQAIERLIALVNERVPKPRPLEATLEAARAAIERGNLIAAINQLGAFQNKVQTQVTPDDADLAAQLIRVAQDVVDVLSRGCDGSLAVRPKIGKVQRHGNDRVRMEFAADSGRIYLVQASSNLMEWETIGVAREAEAGAFVFEDTEAARHPVRFYRVVSP